MSFSLKLINKHKVLLSFDGKVRDYIFQLSYFYLIFCLYINDLPINWLLLVTEDL